MNNLIFCLFNLIVISQGSFINRNINPRIVNGTDVNPGEIPFQVSLQRGKQKHRCGGSIVNEHYVVTAAHCVFRQNPTSISVIVGTVFYKKPHQKRQSSKIITHANYSQLWHRNDIALIKVDSPFEFSELVQPVPLPDLHAKISANSSAIVSGWGRLGGPSHKIPDQLQKAKIFIADQNYCVAVMKELGRLVHPTNICANNPDIRRGQCNGDSGGPLTIDGKLIGIVAWSIKDPYCASTKYPGVYTRVPEYVDWILENAV